MQEGPEVHRAADRIRARIEKAEVEGLGLEALGGVLTARDARRACMRVARSCLAVGLLAVVVGCGPNSLAERGDRYVEAVARAVGGEAPRLSGEARRSVLPRRRARIIEVERHRIGVFDFLSLQGCELGALAGQGMSALGRQMPFSLRLTHELGVIEVSDRCLIEIDDAERRAELSAILRDKRSELGLHAWNAIWAGEEIERYLSRSSRAALGSADGAGAESALAGLAQQIGGLGPNAEEGAAVERSLERLAGARPIGAALRDLEAATLRLDAVSDMLGRIDVDACGPREGRLVRAFRDAYLQFFQRPLGFAHRRAANELPALRALAAASTAALAPSGRGAPAPMRAWFDRALELEGEVAVWPTYRRAMDRHVASWAPILTACGELGSPVSLRGQAEAVRDVVLLHVGGAADDGHAEQVAHVPLHLVFFR